MVNIKASTSTDFTVAWGLTGLAQGGCSVPCLNMQQQQTAGWKCNE